MPSPKTSTLANSTEDPLEPNLRRLVDGRHHDPFEVLGRHPSGDGQVFVRAMQARVLGIELADGDHPLQRVGNTDLFEARVPESSLPERYRIRVKHDDGREEILWDPYCFGPQLGESDLEAWQQGRHTRAYQFLGSHPVTVDGIAGVRFAVWAPNAERVSVVGDFNAWDGRCHPMRVRGHHGVWELFVPELGPGTLYKYEIRNRNTGNILIKTDPFGRATELRPANASAVAAATNYQWADADWMQARPGADWLHEPMSVYELHAGSWRRDADGFPLNYRVLAEELAPYLQSLGFTHVELMPLTEYPLDESWGYQPTGYFAPTTRYGSADDLRVFVDRMHQAGIGVILDWVPGHFPKDDHGLASFDGSPLYEYGDPLKGQHPDWGTMVFNYDRQEVRSFLLSSAIYWLEDFHFDGLRVDAVASMLYLDYSRKPGRWTPNIHGGNENLEAIAFLKQLNETTHRECPGTLTFAEESTAWPGVTQPTFLDGLGFSLKWNMGWMHDTLEYLRQDPVYRKYHHQRITFGPVYAFSENFMLPLSHDEVVHGKGSLLQKMPGDDWQRFANLRLLFAFQWTYPGKKLLFMGQEFAQPWEWRHDGALGWQLLEEPAHQGISRLIADLNTVYRSRPALHEMDFQSGGFHWLRWDDADNSVLSYLRIGREREVIVVMNFTPIARPSYRIGVPRSGTYTEILNTDSEHYGGSNLGNPLPISTETLPWMDQQQSILVTLPPLGAVLLEHVND
ncbi:MAG: 1,4-alpha-glucan branching protein GlgB [Gammaproteobacteria bacterium]|nr:1,4-alpha-glucan branching protein GlgB [Gammaproteobacteria bacterium]